VSGSPGELVLSTTARDAELRIGRGMVMKAEESAPDTLGKVESITVDIVAVIEQIFQQTTGVVVQTRAVPVT
jgi:hypothetical protein